ncbi:MAG TPA: hypothetical protein VJ654_06025 [Noviherbaspirillum sp.]|nr:hypothetical protein [Noviherbaspirillum sp.]
MKTFQPFDNTLLNSVGLNRQAVFNIDSLPAEIAAPLRTAVSCPARQLILIAHAGKKLWESVKSSKIESENPIDDFTVNIVRRCFAEYQPQNTYEILYPGSHAISLQRLGQLAGWHHPTPFMVGIDQQWGTWYAYRAVVIADTSFAPTAPEESTSPCKTCSHKICIASCPAGALENERFDLQKCIGYRKQANSSCKATCLARTSCTVGNKHRYCEEQIHHTYSISMRAIEQYY